MYLLTASLASMLSVCDCSLLSYEVKPSTASTLCSSILCRENSNGAFKLFPRKAAQNATFDDEVICRFFQNLAQWLRTCYFEEQSRAILGFKFFCFKTFIFVSLLNLESFNELFGQSISCYKQIQKFGTTFKKLLRIKKYIIRGIRRKLAKSPAKKSSVISQEFSKFPILRFFFFWMNLPSWLSQNQNANKNSLLNIQDHLLK